VGQATQTLATQESALQQRNSQALRAMEVMDKLSGGPEGRSLERQRELSKFQASLDTPERRVAATREARLKQQQDFYQDFLNRRLTATTGLKEGKEDKKEQQTALKEMNRVAREIQKADAKGSPIAPEMYDAYALSAVKSGNASAIMQYAPEHSLWESVQGAVPFGLLGEPTEPMQVTAYEWLLLRDIELQRPDWDYSKRVEQLQAARKKQGGPLRGQTK